MHYCKSHPHLKQFFPPRGPGMLQSTADTFCALHELTNRCDRWAPEFKPFQTNYQNFKLAYKMLAEDGQDIHHVLQNIMFGDPPSWLWQPSDKLIFCQQQTPDSPEALDALAKAFLKGCVGKSKDLTPTSAMDGPSTSPLALCHCPSFPIEKGFDADMNQIYQIIFDCSNEGRRIVIPHRDVVTIPIQVGDNIVRYDMHVTFPQSITTEAFDERPFNKLQIRDEFFKASSVDYTNLIHLRQCIRKWRSGAICWIDLSSACIRHPTLCPLWQRVSTPNSSTVELAPIAVHLSLKHEPL